jgi:hypothetical protein
MAATAACTNTECTEYEVPKDLSMMPPGYKPILCGACGEEIFVDAEPEPEPPVIDNTLPAPETRKSVR